MGVASSKHVVRSIVFDPPEPRISREVVDATMDVGSSHNFYRIPVIHVRSPDSQIVLIYSHGNAEDISQVYSWCQELSTNLSVDVVAYDYCGYGEHRIDHDNTSATEKNVKQDVEDVVAYTKLACPNSKIVMFGRSLGSGPSIYAASRDTSIAGLVVESGFLTCVKTVVRTAWTAPFDMFENEQCIRACTQPTLVIHGDSDGVVPFYHGKELIALAPNPWGFLWVQGGGHNDLDTTHVNAVLDRLKEYLLDINN
jgi:fermentation-respiration switch protein FrsA (DUF1100 family)